MSHCPCRSGYRDDQRALLIKKIAADKEYFYKFQHKSLQLKKKICKNTPHYGENREKGRKVWKRENKTRKEGKIETKFL